MPSDDEPTIDIACMDTIDARHDHLDDLVEHFLAARPDGRIATARLVIGTAAGAQLAITADNGAVVIEREGGDE